jgi:maltooligosyltrehalose trehalohydrolase
VLVRRGREEFLGQFWSIAEDDPSALADPGDPQTFERSRLDWSERERNETHLALHRDLIALRRGDLVLSAATRELDGAVIGPQAFVIRFFATNGNDRLLIVNLGGDLLLEIVPEPLLAPPDPRKGWTRLWHSEDLGYGGRGAPIPETDVGSWRIPAESATLLAPSGD